MLARRALVIRVDWRSDFFLLTVQAESLQDRVTGYERQVVMPDPWGPFRELPGLSPRHAADFHDEMLCIHHEGELRWLQQRKRR